MRDSVVDKFGRQILTVLPEPGANGSTQSSSNQRLRLRRKHTTRDPNTPAIAHRRRACDELALPTPFIALPGTQLEFRGKAAYMQRTGKYRTLFHQTWVQPVVDQASALPVIVDRSG